MTPSASVSIFYIVPSTFPLLSGELQQKTHQIDIGAVVGSTMFNTLCIVGGSAIVCGSMVQLDSRIFYRDGLSYAFRRAE